MSSALMTVAGRTRAPDDEPLPGYVLIAPLGSGGFGEVWKCEAPGGLHKAVKFVAGDSGSVTDDDARLRQEFEAFQQIKAIRHPFLLSLERVELVGDELVMVMELADQQLGDRFQECRAEGLAGIPRDELLGYLLEAAEALDVIGTKHGLQHLDVKPTNLFVTSGHVQVGDYGLVSKLDAGTGGKSRGLTPRYAAPEVIRGQVHTRSDQYSLGLVYHELLTGGFPYTGQNARQLMLQHTVAAPDLSDLPEPDREAVGRALAKNPDDRFPSCVEFVRALSGSGRVAAVPRTDDRAAPAAATLAPNSPDEPTETSVPSAGPTLRLPPLVTARRAPASSPTLVVPPKPAAPKPVEPAGVRLSRIQSVVPVGWLAGLGARDPGRPSAQVIEAVVRAAEAGGGAADEPGAVVRRPEGGWACRFLTTIDPRIAQVKLELLWEQGGLTMDTRKPGRVVFRKVAAPPPAPAKLFGKAEPPRPAGLEVVVHLPDPSRETGEVVATGGLFGGPPPEFARSGERVIVKLLDAVRRQLNNLDNRRRHKRVAASFPVTVYPLRPDGRVGDPLAGRCKDVSAGGVAVLVGAKPSAPYAYVAFDGVSGATGLGVLVQLVRTQWQGDDLLVTGRFRVDLG